MLLKVFLISVILLAIMMLGIGVKLLFNKNAKLPSGTCQASLDADGGFICGCGGFDSCSVEDLNLK